MVGTRRGQCGTRVLVMILMALMLFTRRSSVAVRQLKLQPPSVAWTVSERDNWLNSLWGVCIGSSHCWFGCAQTPEAAFISCLQAQLTSGWTGMAMSLARVLTLLCRLWSVKESHRSVHMPCSAQQHPLSRTLHVCKPSYICVITLRRALNMPHTSMLSSMDIDPVHVLISVSQSLLYALNVVHRCSPTLAAAQWCVGHAGCGWAKEIK